MLKVNTKVREGVFLCAGACVMRALMAELISMG